MIIGMVAMALLVVLAKFTGYFQYKYMKVQSALENTMGKKSSTKSVKFSGNEIFERFFNLILSQIPGLEHGRTADRPDSVE